MDQPITPKCTSPMPMTVVSSLDMHRIVCVRCGLELAPNAAGGNTWTHIEPTPVEAPKQV